MKTLRYRVRKDSLATKIIDGILTIIFLITCIYLLYAEKKYSAVIFSIFFILILLYFHISTVYKKKSDQHFYSERKASLKKYIQQTNAEFLPSFPEPIEKNKGDMSCFFGKEKLFFYDVVKLIINSEEFYIGELEWSSFEMERSDEWVERQFYDKDNPQNTSEWKIVYGNHTFSANSSLNHRNKLDKYRYKKVETKYYQTMCVLYDKSLFLPEFQLFDETIKDRFLELIHLNQYNDIDFETDNKFSDSWLLHTNKNETLVRELFNKQVRDCFDQFKKKNYIISGYRNMLVIITLDPVFPDKYYSIASDLEKIRNGIKKNKKYYIEKRQ